MRAVVSEHLIAESDDVVTLDGYAYFPAPAVAAGILRAAESTAEDRSCPHGVLFYDVAVDGRVYERAAWRYMRPQPSMAAAAGRVGFWDPVKVVP